MKVLVFGTFDDLHPGHLALFQQAKNLGEELYVVVARDETVINTKKRLPVQNEQLRLQNVQQAPGVFSARLGQAGDKYAVIEEIRPDVIALGYDQSFFVDQLNSELSKRGLHPRIVRLKAFHPERYKSSLLREQQS